MVRDLSEREQQELSALLGVRDLRDTEALMNRGPIPIEDVRRVLQLPPMPHHHLLDEETWMLGGRVVRWLGGEMRDGKDDGDYDLYPGSVAAFERAYEKMRSAGYTVCQVEYSRPWSKLPLPFVLRRGPPPRREGPPAGAPAKPAGPRERTLADGQQTRSVQMRSPEGHFLQVVYIPALFPEGPSVRNLIAQTDLSICQLTLDGRYLHSGPHSWADFVQHRLRTVFIRSARRTAGRLVKYSLRGYVPSPQAVRAVSGSWFSERLGRKAHHA